MKHTKRCRGVSSGKRNMRVADPAPRDVWLTWSQCLTCGAWLPLGPSDESPVSVEVRAATIAAHAVDKPGEPGAWTSFHEDVGWFIASNKASRRSPIGSQEYAGYLARIIFDHDRSAP